jgi:hypothetical protein
MTAPLPAADRPPSPWDEGFIPWGADQAAVLEAEMEALRGRIRASSRPSRLECLGCSAVAVVTEAGRHLRRLLAGPQG